MILPCIDLMEGKVVQLVQGRRKALEGGTLAEMLEKFRAFRQIQVIDLDAAMERGANDGLVEWLAARASIRAGGGVRTVARAVRLVEQGVKKVIVGTAAFDAGGIREDFLSDLSSAVGPERLIVALDSREGRIVVRGWQEATQLSAEAVLGRLEPFCSGFLCTYVDKEGMMAGTDLAWFGRLRAATSLEITAAGGITTLEEVRALGDMRVHAALGMAIYTDRLKLEDLAEIDAVG